MPETHAYTLLNGFVGIVSSSFAVIAQFQEQLDAVLKTTSTILLICVSLVTLYNLLKPKK